jgi:hypothetical protein
MYLQIMYEIPFVRQQLQSWQHFKILRLNTTNLMYTDFVGKEIIKYMHYIDNLSYLFCLAQQIGVRDV